MASDASPPDEEKGKVMRRKQQKETADIEDLTSAGHKALQEGRPQDALSCFKQALKIAAQLQDSRVLRACSFNLGAAYVEAGRPQKGLDFLRQAQSGPKAKRLPDLQFNMALAHNALGQSQEAMSCFLQAAQLYRSQGDGGSEGDTCMEMGRCYSRIQDWSSAAWSFLRGAESYKVASALDSAAAALKEAGSHMVQSDQFNHNDIKGRLTESLSLSNSVSDPSTLGDLYLSVGVSYCRIRCFQEALACFQRALDPAAQRPPLLAKVLHNLGAALNSLGKFSSAVDYHRLAAGLYGSLGCHRDQARCFSNLAVACSQLGDDQEATESFILALQGFRDTGDHLAEVQVCELLAECYLRQKKLQKAVQLYKQALSALSYCKITHFSHLEDAKAVQDRLVDHLCAALQQSLTVTQRSCPGRTRPYLPHPHSSSVEQRVRKTDMEQSLAANQQLDDQRAESSQAERKGEESSGRQTVANPSRSPEGGVTERAHYMSLTPGLHRSEPSEKLHHGELWLDRENPHTDRWSAPPPPQVTSDRQHHLCPARGPASVH
ncbi:tetratricopeptide repeat protein 24 isoform X3 [Girardinichthys multiradiatus]|uniref:tetratricopeptide repeat protein 24 isoform X3 n=1 Tax=Girardinichthys multiradiatus TaxID=208333 RepID=UPI001FAB8B98|nr:tetratricopeptide repeat protein 24 isoform X3 [Girardinichthys multiradiatus]